MVSAMLLFTMLALAGLLLISLSLVTVLMEIMPLSIALLIVGGVELILSAVIYIAMLRSRLRNIRRRWESIYDMSATFETLYREAVSFVQKIVEVFKA